MSGDIPPLPQYAFMAWCSVKAQGHFTFSFTIGLHVHSLQIQPNDTTDITLLRLKIIFKYISLTLRCRDSAGLRVR
jgi:hypothetical protein